MAQHKSAKKRARQSIKRRARNRHIRSRLGTAIKTLRAALDGGKADETGTAMRDAERLIRKAASSGVIPKKRADRQISRLARRANATG